MEQRLASLNWLASKRNGHMDVFSGESQANSRKNEQRCKREGEQGEEKLQEGRLERRVYKKILGVANGCDHAADIGGDGLKDELIAPLWSLKKLTVLNDIDKELVRRNSWQGKLFTP